jgi:hypothetical protein
MIAFSALQELLQQRLGRLLITIMRSRAVKLATQLYALLRRILLRGWSTVKYIWRGSQDLSTTV